MVRCILLRCAALRCRLLDFVVVPCIALWLVHFITLWCAALRCNSSTSKPCHSKSLRFIKLQNHAGAGSGSIQPTFHCLHHMRRCRLREARQEMVMCMRDHERERTAAKQQARYWAGQVGMIYLMKITVKYLACSLRFWA